MTSPNLFKQEYYPDPPWSQPRRTSYKRDTLLIVIAAFFTFAFQWSWSSRPSKYISVEPPKLDTPFDFHSIQPSKNLEYHDCYGFQCARLEVPMDWNATDPEKGDKMALAIFKKPAKVPVTDPRYGGVILLNPGGPGGSGSNFAFRYAEKIALIVNSNSSPDSTESSSSSNDLYFDILSWDPRGVNLTTPGFYCFQDSLHRKAWAAQSEAVGFDLDDEDIFRDVWSRERAMSAGCSLLDASGSFNTVNGNEHLGQYVSTASVVRDMVEIIERHGEWREKTAKEILSKSKDQDVAAILQRTAWQKGEEQLQYWGFSYGTFLGQSFASMQPHRIGRLVLDGVVDADDYARVGWSTNLQDMDEITKNFTTECYEAGPSRCSLYDPQGPSHIYQIILSTLEDLKTNPISTWTPAGPTTISASDATKKIFGNWYSPMASFRQTASLLADLSHRNGTSFAALKAVDYEQSCTLPSQRKFRSDDTDASMAILCSDGDSLLNKTAQDFKTYISLLQTQTPLLGTSWALIPLSCYAYTVRAKWRFAGPFGAPSTANPILFASQTFDPVTPLRNAFKAAELFPGSAVIVAEGLGHTTLAQPSVCAMGYVREYFHRGVLPVSGTRCPVDVGAFDEVVEGGEEGELVDALVEIARTWPWQF